MKIVIYKYNMKNIINIKVTHIITDLLRASVLGLFKIYSESGLMLSLVNVIICLMWSDFIVTFISAY